MAIYPTGTPSDADLYSVVDNFSTTLNGAINASVTTITLTSVVGLPTVGILTIDSEKVKYTGISVNDITGVTRGFSSTSAASHSNGATASFNVVEEHHNASKDEIIAVATDLRNAISADLDDSASVAATAASLKIRLDQVVTKIKEINTNTDWKDAVAKRLTDLVALDGSRTLTGNLPTGGFKLTGLGVGTTAGDSVRYEDVVRLADAQTITGLKAFTDDIVITKSNIGGTVDLDVLNSDNTSSGSNARVKIQVGGTAAGDPFTGYSILGSTQWAAGIDNSDSDKYKVSQNTTPGTNDAIVISTSGPAFAAHGTITNDSAAAGFIGEYIESVAAATAFPATGTFGDLTSISLTAGDWDVSLGIGTNAGAGNITGYYAGISTTAGNSTTGLVFGSNFAENIQPPVSGVTQAFTSIPSYRISLSATTTVYFKYSANYTTGTPTAAGRISARRTR